ncbi:hypothetical protein ACWERV_30065 [Streptomyces sp. NPDC004031]
MSADDAATFVPTLCRYLDEPYREWLDAKHLVTIVQKLAEDGNFKRAKKLANAMYRPRSVASPSSQSNAATALDAYWYSESLPLVVKALENAPKMLATVAVWLDIWLKLSPQKGSLTSFWRPSIDMQERAHHTDSVGHALTDAVRDLAHQRMAAGESVIEITEQLERSREALFLRLSLNTIARSLRSTIGDRNAGMGVSGRPAVDAAVLELACKRLITPELLAGDYRTEYISLAQSILPLISTSQIMQWEHLVANPPHMTAELVGRMQGRSAGEVTTGEISRHVKHWQYRLLTGIGRETLPPQLHQLLDDLITDHGEPQSPNELPDHNGFFIGPTSPLSDADVVALDPPDLLAYLQSWEPDPANRLQFGFPPSAEGLARSVANAVAAKSREYAHHASEFTSLRSTYIGAVLAGFEQAITHKHRFPWQPVLSLISYAATQPDEPCDYSDDFTDGTLWRNVQRQAARLIQIGIEAESVLAIPPALYEMAWNSLEPMTRSAYPSARHEERYEAAADDALTLSLNATRPIALRAAIRLLSAYFRLSKDPESSTSSSPTPARILAALDEHAGPASDMSITVAAVFGEGLGNLLNSAPVWTKMRLERILGQPNDLGENPTQQRWFATAWAVMLIGYRPSRGLYDPLKPWFSAQVKRLTSESTEITSVAVAGARSSRQSLADHILMLYVTGQLDGSLQNETLIDLFASGDSILLRDALGHLGFQLYHTVEKPPETVLARFRALWDLRSHEVSTGRADQLELLDFHWWVASGHFDATWWLPQLAIVARDPEFMPRSMIGKPLALAAPDHAQSVLDIFVTLRAAGQQPFRNHDLLEHAPAILKPALESSQEYLARRALAVAEQLGSDGYLDLMDRIRALPD